MSMRLFRIITIIAMSLAALAAFWLVCDLLLAAPWTLVFEEIAIICAALAPLVMLFAWGVRWLGCRFGF